MKNILFSKFLVEFSCEAVWTWAFVGWKIFGYSFHFRACDGSVKIVYFFLIEFWKVVLLEVKFLKVLITYKTFHGRKAGKMLIISSYLKGEKSFLYLEITIKFLINSWFHFVNQSQQCFEYSKYSCKCKDMLKAFMMFK